MEIYPVMFTGKMPSGCNHPIYKYAAIDFFNDYNFVRTMEKEGVALMLNGQSLDWLEKQHPNFRQMVDFFKLSGCQIVPDFYNALNLSKLGIDLVQLQVKAQLKSKIVEAITPINSLCSCPMDTVLHFGCKCGGK